MPLVKRLIEPSDISRKSVPLETKDELECVSNNTLSCVIQQLSSLSRQSEDLFAELFSEVFTVAVRSTNLSSRIEGLKQKICLLNPTAEEVLLQEINQRKPFKSSSCRDQNLIAKPTRPFAIDEAYKLCEMPPALNKLNVFREDGKESLKFYTNPGYFAELWVEEIKASQLVQKKHRHKNLSTKTIQLNTRLTPSSEATLDGSSSQHRSGHQRSIRAPKNRTDQYKHMKHGPEFIEKNKNNGINNNNKDGGTYNSGINNSQSFTGVADNVGDTTNLLQPAVSLDGNVVQLNNAILLDGLVADQLIINNKNNNYNNVNNKRLPDENIASKSPLRKVEVPSQDLLYQQQQKHKEKYHHHHHNQRLPTPPPLLHEPPHTIPPSFQDTHNDIIDPSFHQGSRSHKHPVSSANHVRPTAPPPAPPTANQIRDMQPDTEIVQPIETDLQEEIKNKLHLRQNNKQQHTPKLQPHNKQAHIIYKHDLPPPPSPPPSLPKDTNPPPPPPPLFETPVAPPPFLPEQAPPTPPILSNQKTPSARDSRSDLLSAIREGIKLRKVEETRQQNESSRKECPGGLDVQSIMEAAFEMRRKVLEDENNEAEEEEEDEEADWSD